MFKLYIKFLIFIIVISISSQANAILGVGDLSFDPAAQAELIAIGKSVADTYKAAIDTIDKLSKINFALEKAYGSYEFAKNFKLENYTRGFKQFGVVGEGSVGSKLSRIRYSMTGTKSKLTQPFNYYTTQNIILDDITDVIKIKEAAHENAQKSNQSNPGQSEVITAQNTSITAILAADEAANRKVKEANELAAAKAAAEFTDGTGSIFNVFASDNNGGGH